MGLKEDTEIMIPSLDVLNRVYPDRKITSAEFVSDVLLRIDYQALDDKEEKHYFVINIYQLAFKCKRWSFTTCHEIRSYEEGCDVYQTQLGEVVEDFYANNEINAIFKACEWVSKNTI